ncbi:coiled-coil domain-containing protein 16 [Moniliophthora roreri MCA 2997]|uniref:Coiled-coil domain-containing protein 16 n=2 Tax=Moniliophthora roreri TaxID=221103 RepID=V2XZI4_MONRO|nr:coiled-coil domain-containing protein 16 [Moniliophthora roreri MCA 2997]KAI3604396.1 coiled-coil domain-containing protein 16 [Moniliophthora roreri]
MADVRALLKAKRQEARITHPLASYNQSGQLRCSACGTIVKHASAWEGHLGSKIHRTTVAQIKEKEREREEQRLRQEEEEREKALLGKRRATEGDGDVSMEDQDQQQPTKKQKVKDAPKGFPVDFFSEPSRAHVLEQDDDEEEEQEEAQAPPLASDQPKSQLDLEWERFQREVVNATDFQETYENATITAEPVMVEVMEGIPTEAAPEAPEQVDEEESRRRKEQEERELIMDRILDEERAQEEADMKVTVMKNKLDALKKKRQAAKAAKSSS